MSNVLKIGGLGSSMFRFFKAGNNLNTLILSSTAIVKGREDLSYNDEGGSLVPNTTSLNWLLFFKKVLEKLFSLYVLTMVPLYQITLLLTIRTLHQ
jgi:hypothetical protein